MVDHKWLAVAVALALGCGSPAAKTEAAPELLTAAEGDAILARWQGAWVMPFRAGDPETSPIGMHEVWTVEGTRMTRWDGVTEAVGDMTLLARCLVRVGDRERFQMHAFAFREGALIVDNQIGVRDGGAITVCSDLGGIYTFDGTTCRYWEKPPGGRRITSHPATCKVDGDRFEATSADDVTAPHTMRFDGDLVRRDLESVREPATRFDTLAAAKASLLD